MISMSRNAQSFLISRMSSDSEGLKTGETTDHHKASVEVAAAIKAVEAAAIKVVAVDSEVIEVAEVEATGEVVEVDTTMEEASAEVAEEATIMEEASVEEVDLEEDMAETTEMTMTEMMAPTGAEVVIEMVVDHRVPISQEAAEAAEVTTDILHEGYL